MKKVFYYLYVIFYLCNIYYIYIFFSLYFYYLSFEIEINRVVLFLHLKFIPLPGNNSFKRFQIYVTKLQCRMQEWQKGEGTTR